MIVVSASWRQRIGWIVVALAGVAVVASQLAASSGEEFQEALDKESELIHRHAELGETFVWFAIAFFVALLALMIWDTMQRRAEVDAGASDPKEHAGRTVALILSIVVVIHRAGGQLPRLPGWSFRREGRGVGGRGCVRWVVGGVTRMRAPPQEWCHQGWERLMRPYHQPMRRMRSRGDRLACSRERA